MHRCTPASKRTWLHRSCQPQTCRPHQPYRHVPAGKPTWLHGIVGRDSAGGRGAAYASREFLSRSLKKRVAGTSFLIQVRHGALPALVPCDGCGLCGVQ